MGKTDSDIRMETAKFVITNMKFGDWEAVIKIYEEGIATGNATVETDAPDWEQWDSSHR